MPSTPAATARPAAAVPATEIKAGKDAAVQVLVGPQQGETSFVLRGRARITIADAVHEVGADDTLFIPAMTPHSYQVLEGPFEFICVVPDRPDQVTLVEPRGPHLRCIVMSHSPSPCARPD